jgi:hypothetical protein
MTTLSKNSFDSVTLHICGVGFVSDSLSADESETLRKFFECRDFNNELIMGNICGTLHHGNKMTIHCPIVSNSIPFEVSFDAADKCFRKIFEMISTQTEVRLVFGFQSDPIERVVNQILDYRRQ